MSFWRDKRSFPVLLAGLFFLFLSLRPWPAAEDFLSHGALLLRPLAQGLQPFGRLAGSPGRPASPTTTSEKKTPDALWLAQREAAFFLSKDPGIASRAAIFTNRLGDVAEPETLWFDAGQKQGARVGMFALVGDVLLGTVDQVEASRCRVRMLAHPASQVGAMAGETRFVAAGASRGKVRVELPSGRGLGLGAEVRAEAVPAILGKLEAGNRGRRGSLFVRPELDASRVQGIWLVLPEPAARTGEGLVLAPGADGEYEPASFLWGEVGSRTSGGLLRSEDPTGLQEGAAILEAEGRLAGILVRTKGVLCWVRWLGDPDFRVDALLVRDDGVVISLPRLGFASRSSEGWRLATDRAEIADGWLFTGSGGPGVPKGIRIGRIRRAQGGPILESSAQGRGASYRICRGRRLP